VNTTQQAALQMFLALIAVLSIALLVTDFLLRIQKILYIVIYRFSTILFSSVALLLTAKFSSFFSGKFVNTCSALLLCAFTIVETVISVLFDNR
jgi:uncharacterized membrane protein